MPIKTLNAAFDHVAPALPLRFGFTMAGMAFSAVADADGEAGCRLLLDIDLGRIPFSAEEPALRRHKLALLGIPDAHFSSKAGRLVVSAERRMDQVPNHLRLVAMALSLALTLRPEVVLGSTRPKPVSRAPASRQRALAA